jgi:hypothetical protein
MQKTALRYVTPTSLHATPTILTELPRPLCIHKGDRINSGSAGREGCSVSVTLSGIWDITKRRGLGR